MLRDKFNSKSFCNTLKTKICLIMPSRFITTAIFPQSLVQNQLTGSISIQCHPELNTCIHQIHTHTKLSP